MKKKSKELQKKIILIAFTVIFILSTVASVVIYQGSSGSDDDITLNVSNKMLNFKRTDEYYTLKFNNQDYRFYSLPPEVEGMEFESEAEETLKNAQGFVMVFDPNEEDLDYTEFFRFDLGQELARLDKVAAYGMTQSSGQYSLPVVTCQNATSEMPVIEISQKNATRIYQEGNCIHVEGRRTGLIRARDRILYSLYGIME